jgi:hypothetical protein
VQRRICRRGPDGIGVNSALPRKIEPALSGTGSATITNAKSWASVGWTDFSGNAASRAQQHWTLGWAGDFSELHGRLGAAVLWQHDAFFTGVESARPCCTTTLHDPGGRARIKLVTTATNCWSDAIMALNYTHRGSEKTESMERILLSKPHSQWSILPLLPACPQ